MYKKKKWGSKPRALQKPQEAPNEKSGQTQMKDVIDS